MTTRPKLLLIDNYDSFTYNLVQAFLVLGAEVAVHRNDMLSVEDALGLGATHLVISPGPGTPRDAGASRAASRYSVCASGINPWSRCSAAGWCVPGV